MGVKEIAEEPPPEPGNQAGERKQRKQNSIGHRQTEAVKLSCRAADLSEANPTENRCAKRGSERGKEESKEHQHAQEVTKRATSLEFVCLRLMPKKRRHDKDR